MKHVFIFLAGLFFSTAVSANNNSTVLHNETTDHTLNLSTQPVATSDDSAPVAEQKWRNNFFRLFTSGGSLDVTVDENISGQSLKGTFSNDGGWGASVGHTFFIGKPINNMFRFGIECTWIEFSYISYKSDNLYDSETHKLRDIKYHKFDIGTGVGASLTFRPVNQLDIKGYAQFCPTFRGMSGCDYDKKAEDRSSDWSSMHINIQATAAFGLSVNYKFIGFGGEYRWGSLSEASLASFSVMDGTCNDWRAYVQLSF